MFEGLSPAEKDNLFVVLLLIWTLGFGAAVWTFVESVKATFPAKSKVATQEQCKLHSRPLKDCPADSHEPKDTDAL